jgi:CRP/FNR family cyclic AMP-dependent transcriptional regulator
MELAELRKVELFANLVPSHLNLLKTVVEEVHLSPSDVICKEGDPADCLYFVIKGKVRISKNVPGMGEEALAILEPGDYFGEMALIDDAPRSADVIANTTVVLGRVDKQKFEDLLFMHRDLAYDLLWTLVRTLAGRLRESNEKMRAFLAMAGQF